MESLLEVFHMRDNEHRTPEELIQEAETFFGEDIYKNASDKVQALCRAFYMNLIDNAFKREQQES